MTPDLIEKIARAICAARALPGTKPVARLSDVDQRAAAAALSVVLEAIGEECAQVASDAWWNHETDETPVLIRARIAEMNRDLSQPT